mmetsp:Transcript_12504/g.27032  ORF Transcript_12504/g.27032 Transcript_12504/m.27032 type:complete len:146 (+) Transcript_12504:431-868(+)
MASFAKIISRNSKNYRTVMIPMVMIFVVVDDDDASGVAVVASDLAMNIDDRLGDVTAERVEKEENARCDGTNDIALGNCIVSTSANANDDSFIVSIYIASIDGTLLLGIFYQLLMLCSCVLLMLLALTLNSCGSFELRRPCGSES